MCEGWPKIICLIFWNSSWLNIPLGWADAAQGQCSFPWGEDLPILWQAIQVQVHQIHVNSQKSLFKWLNVLSPGFSAIVTSKGIIECHPRGVWTIHHLLSLSVTNVISQPRKSWVWGCTRENTNQRKRCRIWRWMRWMNKMKTHLSKNIEGKAASHSGS